MLAALLALSAFPAAADTPRPALANAVCAVTLGPRGEVGVRLTPAAGDTLDVTLTPLAKAVQPSRVIAGRTNITVMLASDAESAQLELRLLADGCAMTVSGASPAWRGFTGRLTGSQSPLYAARIALDREGNPTVQGGGDVLDIAVDRASNRRMNAAYTTSTFRGALLDAGAPTTDLRPTEAGYTFSFDSDRLAIRALDVWPLLAWRPAYTGSTYGHPEASQPHLIPREWMAKHRPFPWKNLSPVQLPFISITDPKDFDRVKEQVDFLAANLRDWGFFCFGEWPLTQRNPDYAPEAVWLAYLEGNKRTCDYAHSQGVKILRWLTDPDIQPGWYPELHQEFTRKGWFSHEAGSDEWLPDYTNPDVQRWIEKQYAELGATGPDFYWIDNNHPTRPLHDPTRFPPEAFREFYLAIQRGLLSTGRNDILMRSGASEWADYSAAGILDVYAPGPDVQNDWTEQQLFVAGTMARSDYLCHFNLWRRGIDDFFPAGPQTLDQTRAMATLLGLSGIGFTTTDIGFPKIPAERLKMLRQLVPIATTRPMDLYRFSSGALPRWWVLNQQDGERAWQVAGLFNWGLKGEETHFMPLDQLGLDPAQEYLAYDFWSQREIGRFRGALAFRIAPTSGRALAIHPVGDRPFIVATDRHVTMGASELANRKWDPATRTLSADFVAGVKGQTFSLTLFCPPTLRPVRAEVAGHEQPISALGDDLFRFPVPCDGPTASLQVTFAPTQLRAERATSPSTKSVIDLADASALRRLAQPDAVAGLLARARSGQAVLLASPRRWSPELARLQASLALSWGLSRATADSPWLLAIGGGQDEPGDDLLFRTTCLACQPNVAHALLRPVGKGLIAVLRPAEGTDAWRDPAAGLLADPKASVDTARAEQEAVVRDSTSTVGSFEVNPAFMEGSAPLRLAKALTGHSLSFHFRRVSPSITPDYWGVPRVSILVNGIECPHNYNPCRPESPPQEWDSLYFAIPKGALRFDGSDRVTIRSAVAARDAEAFQADLQTGLELSIEDPAVAGEPPLGQATLVHLPRFALAPSALLDALLGLDGGIRFLAQGGGTGVTFTGTPYNGWPLKPGGVTHCIFDGKGFEVVVHVPKGSAGVLEAYVYDYEGVRTEDVTFEGGAPVTVEHFANGKWLRFPFSGQQSADGELHLTVGNPRGGNAVLSRVRVKLDEGSD